MKKCKICKKPLVYTKIIEKDKKLMIKAVCKNNHENEIEERIKNRTPWLRKLAKNIFTCKECGKILKPGKKDEIEDTGDMFKIPVRCPAGCKDDIRLIDKKFMTYLTLSQYELR